MRAGHAFSEDAPNQAVILFGYGPPAAPEDARRLALCRLLADCGRFGFAEVLVIHPEAARGTVDRAFATLPLFSPAPDTLALAAPPDAAEALRHALPRLSHRLLIVAGERVLDANWLDLMAAAAPSRAGVVALAEGAGASWSLDGAGTARPEGGLLAPAGLALLERDGVAELAPGRSLAELLRPLAEAGRLGGRQFPAAALGAPDARLPFRAPRPALFLDRDGTLNEDHGYVYDPDRLVFLPGAARAVKRANDLGFYVFLVTNQSGVGRGYYTEADVRHCNGALQRRLRAVGAHLDDVRYCADHPDATLPAYRHASAWRKPAPGMLIDLMEHWPVQREKSLMVGDKDSDVEAGHAVGIESIRFSGGDLDAALAARLQVLAAG